MSAWGEEVLVGKTIVGVKVKSPSVWLQIKEGGWVEIRAEGDCCSEAFIDAVRLAWEAATKVIEQYNKEKDKALESVEQTRDTRRSLSQIATSSTDYQSMIDSASRISQYTGDLTQAQEFVFSGRSEGFDAEALAKYIPVVSSDSLATVADRRLLLRQ